jgi:hypothetical protein
MFCLYAKRCVLRVGNPVHFDLCVCGVVFNDSLSCIVYSGQLK